VPIGRDSQQDAYRFIPIRFCRTSMACLSPRTAIQLACPVTARADPPAARQHETSRPGD
jgi:hypothetical protein